MTEHRIRRIVWKITFARKIHPQEAAILTESVVSMIVKDMRLIAVVEGEGFKEMLTIFESGNFSGET
uniref:Uncharacterized protein n=1 Tax=Knipowitschia caucasica TaxID=637954 RepID=A0AAV2MT16_KNICA